MEPVLLGLAAPAVASEAGSVLTSAVDSVAGPFASILNAIAQAIAPENEDSQSDCGTDVGSQFDALKSTLANQIQNALDSAGVTLTEPLTLRVSEIDGRIEVVGDHPQRALIESALADDPEISQGFEALAILQQFLNQRNDSDDESVQLGEADPDAITAVFSTEGGASSLSFE